MQILARKGMERMVYKATPRGSVVTKKNLRRQQKHDRKQRELEDSAARMGFLDDLEEQRAVYADAHRTEDPEFAD
jgi:hypothetical protein